MDDFVTFLSAEDALSRGGWAVGGREVVSVATLSRGRANGFTPIMGGLVTSGLPPEAAFSCFACEDTLSLEAPSLSSTVLFSIFTSGILSARVVVLGTSFFSEGTFSGSFVEGTFSLGASFFFSDGDLSLETVFFSEGTLSLGASDFFSEGTLSLETFVSSLDGASFSESAFFFFSAPEIQMERVPLVPNEENYSVYDNINPLNITKQLHLLSKKNSIQLSWFALTFV